MKTLCNSVFFLLLLLAFSARVEGQVTVTGHVFAEVVEALTATETSALNFGRFSPESLGGTVKITPTGARSTTGSVALANGNANAASFLLTGESDASFSVSLPAGTTILQHSSGGHTMQVSAWESSLPGNSGIGYLEQGAKVINVGATLQAGNNLDNPVGTYSGTYTITFDYN